MLRIEAARGLRPGQQDSQPIEVLAWDPEYAGKPKNTREHEKPIPLSPIRVFVDPAIRAAKED